MIEWIANELQILTLTLAEQTIKLMKKFEARIMDTEVEAKI
jgi:solute carrier family 25 protein 34/35